MVSEPGRSSRPFLSALSNFLATGSPGAAKYESPPLFLPLWPTLRWVEPLISLALNCFDPNSNSSDLHRPFCFRLQSTPYIILILCDLCLYTRISLFMRSAMASMCDAMLDKTFSFLERLSSLREVNLMCVLLCGMLFCCLLFQMCAQENCVELCAEN